MRLVENSRMLILPTASMMASSLWLVGAKAKWTMGPPGKVLGSMVPNCDHDVGSLRPHELSFGLERR